MHDFLEGLTSYFTGLFAFVAATELSSVVAMLGLVVLIIRVVGDIPLALTAWRELLKKRRINDSSSK